MNLPAEKKRPLEERLKHLRLNVGTGSPPGAPILTPPFVKGGRRDFTVYKRGAEALLENEIRGKWIVSNGKRVFHVEEKIPLSHQHGSIALEKWFQPSYEGLFVICKEVGAGFPARGARLRASARKLGGPAVPPFDPKNCIFLDTETTGLSGGSGTVAFLVGCAAVDSKGGVTLPRPDGSGRAGQAPIGRRADRAVPDVRAADRRLTNWRAVTTPLLKIEQWFIEDFDQEDLLLRKVLESLKGARFLVTFNGKAYDQEILEARFRLHRLPSPFPHLIHLDLLHASRRLWKEVFPDCTLKTLENSVVGFQRQNDIPSEEIPQAYFDYLTRRDPTQLPEIFKHNQLDLLSLVALATKLNILYLEQEASLQEKASIGKIFFSLGERGKAREWLSGASSGRIAQTSPTHQKIYTLCLKSEGLYSDALSVWEQWVRKARFFDPFPYEELAKYYEHKTRDFGKALAITEEAIRKLRLGKTLSSRHDSRLERRLFHRRKRLLRKTQKSVGPSALTLSSPSGS